MCRAYRDTGRVHPLLHAVYAEGAFIRVPSGMYETCVIRTRGKTGLTADAFFGIDKNHAASFMDMAGPARTAIHAGRILTVVAPLAADLHNQGGKFSLRIVGDPVAIEAFRNLVFSFAGSNAVHAPDAFDRIDHHRIACHGYVPTGSIATKLTFMPVPPIKGSVAYCVISCASLAPLPKACFSPFEV